MRYAIRTLRRSSGFAVVAIATLALAIGANTAIFSVADALLWKPLALPDAGRVLVVVQTLINNPDADDWDFVSPANYFDWKRQNTAFRPLAAWQWGSANIAGEGAEAERVEQALVTADFFEAAGVQPLFGRAFLREEEEFGRHHVAVLSYGLWRRRFGGNRGAVGSVFKLDGQLHTIVGVMPPKFDFPAGTAVWTPLGMPPERRASRVSKDLIPLGRLENGVDFKQARAEMEGIARQLALQYPEANKRVTVRMWPIHDFLIGDFTPRYTRLVLGAALFVLLIACANVANLQLARATGRAREIAVRTALGAGRWRLARQLLSESLLLSAAGAVLGALIAVWGVELIRGYMPAGVVRYLAGWDQMRLDGRALLYTALIAMAAGLLAGLAPAWQASRLNLNDTLKEGGRGSSGGRERGRLRSVLAASEIALAMVLLVGAGLMVRGFSNLLVSFESMQPATLLTMRMSVNDARYSERARRTQLYDGIVERLAALPSVESAALATAAPHSGHSSGRYLTIEGRPAPAPDEQPTCQYQVISPAYLQTLRIPLLRGRALTAQDGPDAPRVVLISQQLTRRFFRGEDPIGKRLKLGAYNSNAPWASIVGIVADVQHNGWDRAPRSTVYAPYTQDPLSHTDIALRVAGDPTSVAGAAQAAVRGLDREQPVYGIKTMRTLIHEEMIGLRYVAVFMTIFGALALVLAAVGVYGILAYAVGQQTHEIGVRMALGAARGRVLAMVLRRGMGLTGVGLAIGLALAWGLSRLLSSLVFGVTASDPATFVGFSLALAVSALAACYLPARRAARVDPVVALRHE